MKKQQLRKLTLDKETIKNLQEESFVLVIGGATLAVTCTVTPSAVASCPNASCGRCPDEN